MTRTFLTAGLVVVPILALSTVAHAGPQPSDRAWWPNYNLNANAGHATRLVGARDQVTPTERRRRTTCRFQAGPRSGTVCTAR